jgi:hypothetical protein
MSGFTEHQIRTALDGTFTSVGGRRAAVPSNFIPSHEQPFAAAGRSWITESKARAILQHVRTGATYQATARLFKVSHSTVSDISRGRTWKRLQEANYGQ